MWKVRRVKFRTQDALCLTVPLNPKPTSTAFLILFWYIPFLRLNALNFAVRSEIYHFRPLENGCWFESSKWDENFLMIWKPMHSIIQIKRVVHLFFYFNSQFFPGWYFLDISYLMKRNRKNLHPVSAKITCTLGLSSFTEAMRNTTNPA